MERRHIWNEAPSREDLAAMARALPGGARDLLSTRSRRYRELKDQIQDLDGEGLLDLLAREPQLLRRPILVRAGRVVVGYDPAGLEALFGN